MIADQIKELLSQAIARLEWQERINPQDIQLEHPAHPEHGDYATNLALVLFQKAKSKSSKLSFASPLELAQAIVKELNSLLIQQRFPFKKIQSAPPGFINFWLSPDYFINQGIKLLNEEKFQQEMARIGKSKTIIIDYSSPNIARSFGIGHLRSTNIGQAIYNLYHFLGWRTLGDNHLGDWGTQFGKLIYMIKTKKLPVEKLTIKDLEQLYVEFHRQAEKNPQLEEKGRYWFKKLEEGDSEAKEIWQACIDLSLKEFNRIYRLLGIKIDYAYGESYYHFHGWMDRVLADARKKQLLKKSRGALVIDLPELKVPAMLVKSDGATTYLLRDLATIKFRVQKWQPDLIVYEVGADQKLHLQQVFWAAEKLGYLKRKHLIHLAHGLIRSAEGKFSTRKGRTIRLEEVIQQGIKRARVLVEKSQTSRNLTGQEKGRIARAVALGGIKFNDLKQEIQREIVFDWDKILAIEGYSAPYLQYTYARCFSVLEKASWKKEKFLKKANLSRLKKLDPQNWNEEELALLKSFYQFAEVIIAAANQFAPHLLCQYLFDLAQKFNLFYQKHRILTSTTQPFSSRTVFRLFLTSVTAQILNLGLKILGIKVLSRM